MFNFMKKKTRENGSNSIQHNDDEVVVLLVALKFMLNYPDAYVNKYNFYFEEIYTQKKTKIIESLYQKYEKSLLTQDFNFIYSDEEIFVLWTIINIMTQSPEGEKSQGIYIILLDSLAQITAEVEKKYS